MELDGNFTTDGHIVIHMVTSVPTAKIILHSKELIIDEASVEVVSSDGLITFNVIGHEYDIDREFYVMYLDRTMLTNEVVNVTIHFTALLNDDLDGFYRSTYFDKDANKTIYMAVTQFENTGARRSFPCLDEPAKKAKFNVKLGRKRSWDAR